jgi:hypothetical protein
LSTGRNTTLGFFTYIEKFKIEVYMSSSSKDFMAITLPAAPTETGHENSDNQNKSALSTNNAGGTSKTGKKGHTPSSRTTSMFVSEFAKSLRSPNAGLSPEKENGEPLQLTQHSAAAYTSMASSASAFSSTPEKKRRLQRPVSLFSPKVEDESLHLNHPPSTKPATTNETPTPFVPTLPAKYL